ncbi:glycosyltransferase [Labilibacter marinus]|uniref:glycosyltransferase n=1 Tax=Labilibacter marinus TaxID=1477105 RepID=UPI0009F88DE0|nr:glycosyltransferase [Labilibacter marinus]
MIELVILQTVAPDYRKKLFDEIKKELGNRFLLYAGDSYFEESVKTCYDIKCRKHVRNYYLFNRKLLFQTGIWRDAIRTKILVIEMNPRIISNWIILIIRSVLLRKTILWGHSWPRLGKNSKTDIVRNWMRLLGQAIITYTKTQAVELKNKMPKKKILFAPNSLFYAKEMDSTFDSDPLNIIYVGRLIKKKKASVLVDAFVSIMNKLPDNAQLVIVGDGEEKGNIEEKIGTLDVKDRINLLGHIGDYTKLKGLYSKSLLSVSPGYVGLSITQSFGFGVPMLISKGENHSPEIEAAQDGINCLYFDTNNVKDLENKLLDFYKNKDIWIKRRAVISENCRLGYSIEVMANTFVNLLNE